MMSSMKKVFTLVFLRAGKQVLLGMKKRGFGVGKWNGFGGKLEPGESFAEGAMREVKEECGLDVNPDDLEETAVIEFEFQGDPVKLEVHVFQTRKFCNDVTESEEMRPEWFDETAVPFSNMWVDASCWYHLMFQNKKFKAYFLLQGYDKILQENIEIL